MQNYERKLLITKLEGVITKLVELSSMLAELGMLELFRCELVQLKYEHERAQKESEALAKQLKLK